jgi:hypothetical protein
MQFNSNTTSLPFLSTFYPPSPQNAQLTLLVPAAMTALRGLISRDLNICLVVFSTAFVTLRFYVRGFMLKALGLDDAFSLAALVWTHAVILNLLQETYQRNE